MHSSSSTFTDQLHLELYQILIFEAGFNVTIVFESLVSIIEVQGSNTMANQTEFFTSQRA
mgnify:FL=1